MTSSRSIRSAFEAMLFTWGEPLPIRTAAEVLNITEKEATKEMEALRESCEKEQRGLRIRRINKSYQMVTAAAEAEYIERLCTPVKKRRLSQSALEVLAIVAYRQPVTRSEIDAIRGIKCDRVMEGLVRRGLVEEKGRSNGIGRPILYGTTDTFLRYFGFETLKELPEIEDLENFHEFADEEREDIVPNQMTMNDLSWGMRSEASGEGSAASEEESPAAPGERSAETNAAGEEDGADPDGGEAPGQETAGTDIEEEEESGKKQ